MTEIITARRASPVAKYWARAASFRRLIRPQISISQETLPAPTKELAVRPPFAKGTPAVAFFPRPTLVIGAYRATRRNNNNERNRKARGMTNLERPGSFLSRLRVQPFWRRSMIGG